MNLQEHAHEDDEDEVDDDRVPPRVGDGLEHDLVPVLDSSHRGHSAVPPRCQKKKKSEAVSISIEDKRQAVNHCASINHTESPTRKQRNQSIGVTTIRNKGHP